MTTPDRDRVTNRPALRTSTAIAAMRRRRERRRTRERFRPEVAFLEQRTLLSALTTLTALRASAVSAVRGQSVTLTATVSDLTAGGATPNGGTVTFSDQGGTLGTAALAGGLAEFTTTSLAAGTDTITASYGGVTNFAASATGTIVTAVGNGIAGYQGDNGPATAAELNQPIGMTFDSAGDLFITDYVNNVVREVVKATGDIITVAGNGIAGDSGDGGPATAAELNGPDGIVVDAAGDLFISENYNNDVREVVKATGDIITVAGNGTAGYSGDGGPATAAELHFPHGLAIDAAGNLFIADSYNYRIREVVKATGDIITVAGAHTYGYSGDGGPATNAELDYPFDVALDPAGDLFIADTANNRIREVVKSTGDIYTVAGDGTAGYTGDNGPATSAELHLPYDVAVDAAGDLFIVDSGNGAVREVVAATGDIITVAGNGTVGYSGDNGPATAAQMNNPCRIAIDSAGDLFISDSYNNVVREVTPAVTVTISPALTSQVAITSPALFLIAGSREQMTVQLENASGNPLTASTAETISLSTTSAAGAFYATQTSTTPINSVVIPAGDSSTTFYYSDTRAGLPAVTISDSALGSASNQLETVYPEWVQSFVVVTTFSSADEAGTAATVTVTAYDTYGNLVDSGPNQYLGTVDLSCTDSRVAGLPASYTFSALDAGSHTFSNVILVKAGGQSISVTDSATGTIAGNVPVSVVPARAQQLVVTTSFASPDVAGTLGTVTVTAEDAYNNPVSNGPDQYLGTVNLSSTDSQVTGLPKNSTFTALDAGSHTFTGVVLKTAGSQVITATDSGTTTIKGSTTVDVAPLAASQLVFTTQPPSPIIPGQAFSVVVSVEDSFHNVVPGFNGNVTISAPNEPGLSATVQARTGVATFTRLTADTAAEGESIQATSGGLRVGVSNPLTVTPLPTIIHEQVWTTQKKNAKGKPIGMPVFAGFQLVYSTAMNSSTAESNARYHVYSETITRSKKTQVISYKPVVNFTTTYNPLTNTVTLSFKSKTPFALGGKITVSGVTDQAGVPLNSNDTTLTILKNANNIELG